MDWKKAKIYLIVSLAIVNVALLWSLQFTPFKPVFTVESSVGGDKSPEKLSEILIKKNMELSPDLNLKRVPVYDVNIKYEKYELKEAAYKLLENPKKKSENIYASSKPIIPTAVDFPNKREVKGKKEYLLESYDEGLSLYFHRVGSPEFPDMKDLDWTFAEYSQKDQDRVVEMVSAIEDIGSSLRFERYANTAEGELLMFNFVKDDIVLESGQLLAFVASNAKSNGEVSFKLSMPEISKGQGTKRSSIYPSQAIMKLFMKLDKMPQMTRIEGISLVYRLSISSIESNIEVAGKMASGDALPFWRINLSSGKVYYIEAV